MSVQIKPKRRAADAAAPSTTDITDGEMAVNTVSKTLYIRIGNDIIPVANYVPTESPGFTGVPTAPTAAPGSDSTQIATTAFVKAATASSGGGGLSWSTVSTNLTMQSNKGYVVSGSRTLTLPASASAGSVFIIHAYDGTVTVASNGNVITGVGASNDLTLAPGDTAHLVARSVGNLEII